MSRSAFFLAMLVVCAALGPSLRGGGAQEIVWKPEPQALLKLEGRAVRTWNVYRSDKKKQLVLVQLGHRFLILDTKERTVHELAPTDVKPHGKDVASPEPGDAKVIPSAEWVMRDVGPAQLIRVRLMDYGRVLELQVPHPYNFRVAY